MCDSKKASHPGFQAGVFFVGPEAKRLLQRRVRGRCQRFCPYTRGMLFSAVPRAGDRVRRQVPDPLQQPAGAGSPGGSGPFVAGLQRAPLILRKQMRFHG